MKKSKTFLATILACSLLLVGCSKSDENSSSNPPPATDYTVTQAEYEAAMTLYFKNLTYKCYEVSGGTQTEEVHMKFLADGSSHQVKAGGWGNLCWHVQPDNKVYQVSKYEENYYVKSIRTLEGYQNGNYGDDMGAIGYVDYLKDKYSELSYDATSHSYKGRVLFEYPPEEMDVEIKFEDKKLSSLYFEQDYMGEKYGMLINVFDYGTTTIDFDSLHYKNDFVVKNRKFAFKTSESSLDPVEKIDFDNQNATSYIEFNEDGTFSMYVHYDYKAAAEKTYTGTYAFTILDSETNLSFHFNEDGRDVTGNFTVFYDAQQQGAEVLVPVKMNATKDIYFRLNNPVPIN